MLRAELRQYFIKKRQFNKKSEDAIGWLNPLTPTGYTSLFANVNGRGGEAGKGKGKKGGEQGRIFKGGYAPPTC